MNLKRKRQFDDDALDNFMNWLIEDKKVYLKIIKLLKEIRRTPFEGEGKPEPLKHNLKGFCGFARAVKKNYTRTSFGLRSY